MLCCPPLQFGSTSGQALNIYCAQAFTFSKPSAAWQTETSGCGDLQAQTSASIFAYRGEIDNGQAALSQAEVSQLLMLYAMLWSCRKLTCNNIVVMI